MPPLLHNADAAGHGNFGCVFLSESTFLTIIIPTCLLPRIFIWKRLLLALYLPQGYEWLDIHVVGYSTRLSAKDVDLNLMQLVFCCTSR